MSSNRSFAAALTLFAAITLVACGGGSSGGAGGGIKSAENLIVKVNNDGSASLFQTVPGQETRMLAALTNFLISDAEAQTLGLDATVCVYLGVTLVGCEDTVGGVAMFVLPAGNYTVCIGALGTVPDTSGTCTLADSVVVSDVSTVTVVASCNDVPTCEFDVVEPPAENPTVQPISDLNQGQDLNFDVTICHIPPGNPAAAHLITINGNALKAHLNHGDTLPPSPCPPLTAGDAAEDSTTDGNSSNNGNNGNRGNSGNAGNNGNNGNNPKS